MPRSAPSSQLTPRAREIVDAARELLESDGVDGLSMRRLANRLGIRAPSLYSHFADKQALENALIADGLSELGDRTMASIGTADPVGAIMTAYRDFAREHPHLYQLLYHRPLDRERLDLAAEEHSAAALRSITDGDYRLARSMWAYAHGMVELERTQRFPPTGDLEEVWLFGVGLFRAAVDAGASA
jgi:AcrR family transcriptional regulator